MHSKIVIIDEAMSMIIRELKLPSSMKLGKRIKLILRKNFSLDFDSAQKCWNFHKKNLEASASCFQIPSATLNSPT